MSAVTAAPAGPKGFYLASAACMLGGCYLVSGASSSAPHDVARLLPIIGWLNLYELLLIAVAGFLAARGLLRDARLLLTIEAVFLTDAAHLASECVTQSEMRWPAVVAGLLLLLGAKLFLIAAAFQIRLASLPVRRAVPALLFLVTLPAILSSLARTGMSLDLPLYGIAWAIGLMLMVEAVSPAPAPSGPETMASVAQSFARALRAALAVSLPLHLLASHWLYDARFQICSVAPWLLALAVRDTRASGSFSERGRRAFLPAFAVLLSLPWPDPLAIDAGIVLSPLRVTLVVAALVYLYDYSLHRQRFFLLAAAACSAGALAGYSLESIFDRFESLTRTGSGLRRFNTRVFWGGASVVVAYLLLWLGARSSLRGGATPVGRTPGVR